MEYLLHKRSDKQTTHVNIINHLKFFRLCFHMVFPKTKEVCSESATGLSTENFYIHKER
jgi:hypothetical protein